MRRMGTDRATHVAMDSATNTFAKSAALESYQKRQADEPYTRYVLGAMQEVDAEYTRISIETAQRIGRQLDQALAESGYPVEFRLQGSVPLNIHIRGVSDVDLLTLSADFHTYSPAGSRATAGHYVPAASWRTSKGVLLSIRQETEKTLRARYSAATVDTGGGKAVKIYGGSLPRPVDVVPSHWFDTFDYQQSGYERDRAVTIFDKNNDKTIENYPFLHIALIDTRDTQTAGSLKKAIRLCKNVRSDSDYKIDLPSFDIASLMYHSDQTALARGSYYELAVLTEAQRHMDYLYHHKSYAQTLRVPDGSRRILDTDEKFEAMKLLSYELDDLLRQVAKEQKPLLRYTEQLSLTESREAVNLLRLPQLY